jgi:hypothetical protein
LIETSYSAFVHEHLALVGERVTVRVRQVAFGGCAHVCEDE